MKILRKFPYWYLLAIPLLLISLGVASNQAVLIANHGKFPVMLNERQYKHFCHSDFTEDQKIAFSVRNSSVDYTSCASSGQFIDNVHSVMGPNSQLKALSDIFSLGPAIYSVGDGLLFLGYWLFDFLPYIWLGLTLRKLASLID